MMNKILRKQIGRYVEAYIDDIVINMKWGNSHIDDLRETFATLEEYNLKLNPTKCIFGVKSGKFLGFMTLERGIKANSHKIEVILRLAVLWCVKDIQRLNGCIAALGRFILKSVEKCTPFFNALKLLGKTF